MGMKQRVHLSSRGWHFLEDEELVQLLDVGVVLELLSELLQTRSVDGELRMKEKLSPSI